MPAFFNGVFGHKPSRHIIPNELQFPAAHTSDQRFMLGTGPMCRFSCDLKPMMKILVHEDQLPSLRLDEPVDIKKIKIFYQENDGGGFLVGQVDRDIQDALNRVVKYFKNTIKVEVNKVNISRVRLTLPIWFTNMSSEGSPSFAEQIAEPPKKKVNAWLELVKWIFGKMI
jgi:fatty acid amide hydrolase 2